MKGKKSLLCAAAAAILCCSLSACGKTRTDSQVSLPADSHRLGIGCIAERRADGKDRMAVRITAAAVLLSADGRIAGCRVDEVDYTVELQGGKAAEVTALQSKHDLGDRYVLTAEDTGGRAPDTAKGSWRQQADAFAAFVCGKTAGEVSGIAATDGTTDQIDGCGLTVTGLIRAVRAAADSAAACRAAAGDRLALALVTRKSGEATTEKPAYDTQIAAVTVADGRITACRTDELQTSLTVGDGAFTDGSGELQSKRAKGDAYGMKAASSIRREWYEQADAFDRHAVGKTADELAAVRLDGEGKTDAISGCTVAVDGLTAAAVEAAGGT